jgi:hypothetical protein
MESRQVNQMDAVGMHRSVPVSGSDAAVVPRPPYRPVVGTATCCVLVALAVAAGLAAGFADSNAKLGVGLGALLVLIVLPLRYPLEAALLLLFTGWLPVEDLFGADRSLFQSIAGIDLSTMGGLNVSGMRLVGGTIGLAIAIVTLWPRLRTIRLPRWLAIGVGLYVAATLWGTLTIIWAPDHVDGFRALAKLAFPLLVAAVIVADPHDMGFKRLVRTVVYVLAASLLAGTLYGFIGAMERSILPTPEAGSIPTWFGWAGWSFFAFFLAVVGVLLLALADSRFGIGDRGAKLWLLAGLWALALLAFAQIPFALKRTPVAAAGVGITAYLALAGSRRWTAPIGIVAAVAVLLLFPPLVERNVYPSDPAPTETTVAESPPPAGSAKGGSAKGGPNKGQRPANDASKPPSSGNATEPTTPAPSQPSSASRSADAVERILQSPGSAPNVIQLEGRDSLWRMALDEMSGLDYVIGSGLNGWSSSHAGGDGSHGQLHGEPIRVFYEMGAIGLLLFAASFIALLIGLAKQALGSPRWTLRRALSGAAFGAITGYLITTLTDNTIDYYLIGAYVWAVVALAIVVLPEGQPRDDGGVTPPRPVERDPSEPEALVSA